jgi:hypothetical protein
LGDNDKGLKHSKKSICYILKKNHVTKKTLFQITIPLACQGRGFPIHPLGQGRALPTELISAF